MNDSKLNSTEESEDTIDQVLDARDLIESPAETKVEPSDSPATIQSTRTQARETKEVEIPLFADDAQPEDFPVKPESDITLTTGDSEIWQESAPDISVEAMPPENDDPAKADPKGREIDGDEDSPPAENITDTDSAEQAENDDAEKADPDGGGIDDDEGNPAVENITDTDPADDADDTVESDEENQAREALPGTVNDLAGDVDDAIADKPPEAEKFELDESLKSSDESKPEKAAVEKNDNTGAQPHEVIEEEVIDRKAKLSATPKNPDRQSSSNKLVSLALLVLIVAGIIIYNNPSLIGLTKAVPPAAAPPVSNTASSVTPVPQKDIAPALPGKLDQCLAKIEDAVRLRNELLEKKKEIYELDLYYRNGISDLAKQVYQDTNKAGIDTFEQASKNKSIELNLRTIQRRRAYIKELAKPAFWTKSGSEELFYLIRKAQLDLQLMDIAGGIDLNKHMRHLHAAVHKYRLSPEKLVVNPPQSNLQPLEKIWQQVNNQKYQLEQISLNAGDEQVLKEICAGNFKRIAELTSISPDAAKCLSQMEGSDLFLNSVTTLSPEAAKQLFQWQGNWICLNGVKELSPSAAEYLFKWKGSWLSLNSLHEFPPELAQYLLKWEGRQLELMGLNLNKNEEDQKTLKYFALWETTGGKLYVTDKIRKKIESLM